MKNNKVHIYIEKKNLDRLPTISKEYNTPSPKVSDKKKCRNCKKYFDPKNNDKCYYHPGELITDTLRVNNNYDELKYSCCGGVEVGFFPNLVPAVGCKINNNHISYDESNII